MKENIVQIETVSGYNEDEIFSKLNDELFSCIKFNSKVVIKPNWVLESHQYRKDEWDYIITHPVVISAVLRKVIDKIEKKGSIIIADAPTTEASFQDIINKYPVRYWHEIASKKGIEIKIIDLRDNEWTTKNGFVIERKKLKGDPKGKTEVNLFKELSEFHGHKKSIKGYYGADYNSIETNKAHDGKNNLYRVSKSIIEADVFINMPKLKTHRKAGITCCLKNLVGINTFKNFLPHHSEGSPKDGGDQYPKDDIINARIEGSLMAFLKKGLLQKQYLIKHLSHLSKIGKLIFGDTRKVIRSGNWFGNDTAWRMILDLNKILYYAKPNGSMNEDASSSRKHFIGIVDAILAGEGDGPLSPDPVKMNYIISGLNPVAIDSVSATLMGFNFQKIPSINNAYLIKNYKLFNFLPNDVEILYKSKKYNLFNLPKEAVFNFEPHFGWKNFIET